MDRPTFYSPKGNQLNCKNWEAEALYRMLLNSLDPRVAEKPEHYIVYGSSGKAIRDGTSLSGILERLKHLERDETLVIQSGKAVAQYQTFYEAPRVIMSVGMMTPNDASLENFSHLEKKGLTMYGQATAASWAYIGVQGILQATFETLAEIAKLHFNDTLAGKIVLSSGLGGMGSAQPISISMLNGVSIIVEVDENKINKRLLNNYCDICVTSTDEAIQLAKKAASDQKPLAIAILGNATDIYEEFFSKNFTPDIVTDQTAAHDLINGYIPSGLTLSQANYLRVKKPKRYIELAQASIIKQVTNMLKFQKSGSIVFDYGNNIRGQAYNAGLKNAFEIRGFVECYIRPLYEDGRGPCRWIALSGNPSDIYKIDERLLEIFPEDSRITRWIHYAQEQIYFHGLPARTCWLNYVERKQFGALIHSMVASGELSAPIAITRDHSEGSSIAAPLRETENMKDGSDAIADWPILLAMLNASSGASLVSLQHGGGVGIGNSIHSGMTIVADGTEESLIKLNRVLSNEPALNIIRHADAGYEKAINKLSEYHIRKPL